eukprot:m.47687 g.47687  ORF g.47687 m.47687 type:complete len:116 (+) comp20553_c0_seq2:598-945(+)
MAGTSADLAYRTTTSPTFELGSVGVIVLKIGHGTAVVESTHFDTFGIRFGPHWVWIVFSKRRFDRKNAAVLEDNATSRFTAMLGSLDARRSACTCGFSRLTRSWTLDNPAPRIED